MSVSFLLIYFRLLISKGFFVSAFAHFSAPVVSHPSTFCPLFSLSCSPTAKTQQPTSAQNKPPVIVLTFCCRNICKLSIPGLHLSTNSID